MYSDRSGVVGAQGCQYDDGYTHVLNRGGRGVRSPADSLGSVLEVQPRGA